MPSFILESTDRSHPSCLSINCRSVHQFTHLPAGKSGFGPCSAKKALTHAKSRKFRR